MSTIVLLLARVCAAVVLHVAAPPRRTRCPVASVRTWVGSWLCRARPTRPEGGVRRSARPHAECGLGASVIVPPMTGDAHDDAAASTSAHVRWVSESSNVPAVRRFVRDLLTEAGRVDLVDDVSLAATELAANAVLHSGSPYFEVQVVVEGPAVHLRVSDRGPMRARAVADRADVAASVRARDPESMTGRGLLMVASLARSWGIDDLPRGIRVWAEFAPADGLPPAAPPRVSSTALPHGKDHDDDQDDDAADVRVIQLLGCPPDLLLAHDAHLADTARELHLYGASRADEDAARSARQVAEVVRLSAVSWDAARLLASQALAQGRREVDVRTAPADAADLPRKIEVLRHAVATAESLMEQGLLMTTPAPAAVQRWRDWVECEMVEQTTQGRAPVPFAAWLAAHGLEPTD